ncbi:hypothetical protein [Caballeronia sp. LZ034LL]|uniref:hypothetical protein n=1 Tax=Caballeronia sp. LZ034LL TaxID=3038567 RepID=UPI00285A40C0|nr:hypothetical protein [Caballeronia sp. LZ034LL]MDR5837088.1 hypothetical protein [Caballeronia sp. LZ034LL]
MMTMRGSAAGVGWVLMVAVGCALAASGISENAALLSLSVVSADGEVLQAVDAMQSARGTGRDAVRSFRIAG